MVGTGAKRGRLARWNLGPARRASLPARRGWRPAQQGTSCGGGNGAPARREGSQSAAVQTGCGRGLCSSSWSPPSLHPAPSSPSVAGVTFYSRAVHRFLDRSLHLVVRGGPNMRRDRPPGQDPGLWLLRSEPAARCIGFVCTPRLHHALSLGGWPAVRTLVEGEPLDGRYKRTHRSTQRLSARDARRTTFPQPPPITRTVDTVSCCVSHPSSSASHRAGFVSGHPPLGAGRMTPARGASAPRGRRAGVGCGRSVL